MKVNIKQIIREEINNEIRFYNSHISYLNPLPKLLNEYNQSLNKQLYEGLIKSYPIGIVLKHLSEYCCFTTDYQKFYETINDRKYRGYITNVKTDNDEDEIIILCYDTTDNDSLIKKTLSFYGYFIAMAEHPYFSDELIEYHCEKKYGDKVNDIVKEHEFIYHLTLKSRLENILKNGFIPKHHDKKSYHESRIYFSLIDNGELQWKMLAYEMYGKIFDDLVIIKVKTDGLENNNFYFDPNMKDAVFTTDNVKPNNIVSYRTINIFGDKKDETLLKELSTKNNIVYKDLTSKERKEIINELYDKYFYCFHSILNENDKKEMLKENKDLYKKIILENIIKNYESKY